MWIEITSSLDLSAETDGFIGKCEYDFTFK